MVEHKQRAILVFKQDSAATDKVELFKANIGAAFSKQIYTDQMKCKGVLKVEVFLELMVSK